MTCAYFEFLATVIFSLLLFHLLINPDGVKDAGYSPVTSPLEVKRVLDISNDPLESVVLATGACQCESAYDMHVGRCVGEPASSINSAPSSSAVVQTWINGAINLSLQMYDFRTSILFPDGYRCPPPQICVPRLLSSLTRASR